MRRVSIEWMTENSISKMSQIDLGYEISRWR